jgi:hypothetical protein
MRSWRSILRTWRKQAHAGKFAEADEPGFLPVFVDTSIAVDAPIATAASPSAAPLQSDAAPLPGTA